jgi:hypothetical protein
MRRHSSLFLGAFAMLAGACGGAGFAGSSGALRVALRAISVHHGLEIRATPTRPGPR